MRPSVVTLPLLVLTACSPMKNGIVNVEARGALTGESLALIAGAAAAGSGGQSSSAGDHDVGTVGYGVQAAVNTSAIDMIGSFDERRIQNESVPVVSIGLRKRFGEPDTPLYIFALARSSRSDTDSANVFNGGALGIGLLIQFAENGFIDTSIAWEHTNDLVIPNGDKQTDEGVFQIGIGWSF